HGRYGWHGRYGRHDVSTPAQKPMAACSQQPVRKAPASAPGLFVGPASKQVAFRAPGMARLKASLAGKGHSLSKSDNAAVVSLQQVPITRFVDRHSAAECNLL